MSIDFPSAAQCATFGYSFDNVCSGITHTISQNWRVMKDSQGLTFFAPVSSVASLSTTQGPDGQTGMTGLTGMTGNTGAVGVTGPQGFTFADTQTEYGLMFLPDGYEGGDESNGVTLASTDFQIAGVTGDSLSVGRAKEQVFAYTSSLPMATSAAGERSFVNIDLSSLNTFKFDIDTTTEDASIAGFKLVSSDNPSGKYANIVLKRSGPGGNPKGFGSDFKLQIGSTTLQGSALDINYATGITYELGQAAGDVDVFYVSVINVDLNPGTQAPTGAEILVNHQRYYTT
jgi:hypothetical protein